MASPQPSSPTITPEEYLALDRASDLKHEFVQGQILAMSGASRAHNLITLNVGGALNAQLAERPCEVYASDMRVKVSATGEYAYPDVVAVCGEPIFEDAELDTLTNPIVIVEVLSPSTQDYDRGTKFALYRTIESLQDFVLVSQVRVRVEHHARRGPHQWLLTEYTDREDILTLPALGCTLRLADLYRKVSMP